MEEEERGIKITNIDKTKQCDIHVVTKCYIFDKRTKCYFYGLDGWENINWGNDKAFALLMIPDMAVKMLTDLRNRNTEYELHINVL